MFRNCKTLEECNELFNKIKIFINTEEDLLKLLASSYHSHIQILREKMKEKETILPGKYQLLKTQGISVDDPLWSDLSYDIIYYINHHEEFKKTTDYNFIMSVEKYAFDNQFVTRKQYDIVVKIYYAHNMEAARPESYV